MSRAYQIAVVETTTPAETVDLADVLGRVPTEQFASVLQSEWAVQEQWQRQGDSYTLKVTPEVTMEVRVTGEGVVVRRRVSTLAERRFHSEAGIQHQQLIADADGAYRLCLNRLLGQVMLTTVGETLKEQHKIAGDVVVTIQELDGRFELQLELADM